jgi:hypothetical protein
MRAQSAITLASYKISFILIVHGFFRRNVTRMLTVE